MIRSLSLIIFVLTTLPGSPATAQDDNVVSLWAEIEDLGGEQTEAEAESDAMTLGPLEPLLDSFLSRHRTTSTVGAEEDAPSLDECWCPSFYEDRGPKRETGLRLVAEYTFEF